MKKHVAVVAAVVLFVLSCLVILMSRVPTQKEFVFLQHKHDITTPQHEPIIAAMCVDEIHVIIDTDLEEIGPANLVWLCSDFRHQAEIKQNMLHCSCNEGNEIL